MIGLVGSGVKDTGGQLVSSFFLIILFLFFVVVFGFTFIVFLVVIVLIIGWVIRDGFVVGWFT